MDDPSQSGWEFEEEFAAMAGPKILLYLIRRDIRLSDNPVFHEVVKTFSSSNCKFTHLLPIYVFTANQIETSGLFTTNVDLPFPEARSQVGGFWRCGPHRAKFLGECVWDLQELLRNIGSDLNIRAGHPDQVIEDIIDGFSKPGTPNSGSEHSSADSGAKGQIVEVWMTEERTTEEKNDEGKIKRMVEKKGINLRLFKDEKYFIDDDDLPYSNIDELPDIFTTFRKSLEPLRDRPRSLLPSPKSLPPFPGLSIINQPRLSIPSTREKFVDALLKPLLETPDIQHEPILAADDDLSSFSAHPFEGGETHAHDRLKHLLVSGVMASYKNTRNGLIGTSYSTKLSAYLAHGCITARQVHATMARFEDGDSSTSNLDAFNEDMLEEFKRSNGYGKGENDGTIAVRFELLWRDYMRLCAQKFGSKLFSRDGFRNNIGKKWESIDGSSPSETQAKLQRFLSGRTGIGLVDASQRELYLSGYTGNRARQNVASFLAKHLYIDWRLGAEWYESMLVDYDAASNWGNWQYVAGVGNDPREGRIFNPIKQALDYDPKGEYIKMWIPQLRGVQIKDEEGAIEQEKLMGLYQAWRLPEEEKKSLGLDSEDWVSSPLVTIEFSIGRKPKQNTRPGMRREVWGGRGGPSGSSGRGGYRGGGTAGIGGRGRGGGFRGGRGRGFDRGDYSMGGYRGHAHMTMSG